MNRLKLYGLLVAAMLLLFAFWLLLAGTNDLAASPNITPTLIVTARGFLPVIYGVEPLYTPTATAPPPTLTPWATPTATATAPATAEFQTPKPTLYALGNGDGDGNYAVTGPAVRDATR